MDTNKKVTIVATVPSGYKYVTSIAITKTEKLGYTAIDKAAYDCVLDKFNSVKAVHIIGGKLFPMSSNPFGGGAVHEVIKGLGDNFFVTDLKFNGVGMGGGASSAYLRKVSDGILVRSFEGSGVVYSGDNYALIFEGYYDVLTAGAKQNILRVNMVNGDITYVIKDQLIRIVDIVGSTMLIKYGAILMTKI